MAYFDNNGFIEKSQGKEVVYFARKGDRGPVKIGRTSNLKNRIISLSTSCECDLYIIGAIEGLEEKKVHEDLEEYRLSGEWFSYNSDLVDYMYEHLDEIEESQEDFLKRKEDSARNIGKIIKEGIYRIHKTQVWLADEIGVGKALVNRWIRGESIPGGDNLLKIIDLLDASDLFFPIVRKEYETITYDGDLRMAIKELMSISSKIDAGIAKDSKEFSLSVKSFVSVCEIKKALSNSTNDEIFLDMDGEIYKDLVSLIRFLDKKNLSFPLLIEEVSFCRDANDKENNMAKVTKKPLFDEYSEKVSELVSLIERSHFTLPKKNP